jgi:hypothetical protein
MGLRQNPEFGKYLVIFSGVGLHSKAMGADIHYTEEFKYSQGYVLY